MAAPPREMTIPKRGVWRIGRGSNPLQPPPRGVVDLADSRAGNRWDSYTGVYSVLYCGTDLEVCFGETLHRFPPDPSLAFIDDEWEERNFMRRGHVPADWRTNRTAVRARPVEHDAPFFNVENRRNLDLLWKELGPSLRMFGHTELDVSLLRGTDRRVTRLISEWIWQQRDEDGAPRFAGLRYLSRRATEWECWAIYDDVELEELERQPILLTTQGLEEVQKKHGIRLF